MHDGKALQSGTTHYFGQGFAEAFGVKYLDKDGKIKFPHQTSWGVSTRLIGAIIMVHGDDNGLVLPPFVAPIQTVIIPIRGQDPLVQEKVAEINDVLKADGIRVKVDNSDKPPGWKFSEYEMKGFFETLIEKGRLHNIYFIGEISISKISESRGYRAFDLFVEYGTGIHFGGKTYDNNILSYEYLSYTEQSQSEKAGIGMLPNVTSEDETRKVVIPLAKK